MAKEDPRLPVAVLQLAVGALALAVGLSGLAGALRL